MNRLKIKDFSLLVHLGVSTEERSVRQEVRISLDLEFSDKPLACKTDQIDDTFCYAKLCTAMRETLSNREFKTIEHLTDTLSNAVHQQLAGFSLQGRLYLHKVRPPIEGLLGGVIFEEELKVV